ncbi:MAG: heme exporter protein CcmD [Methyloceanibacter sp.]
MPDLGPHAIFILAAYGVTFVAVAALAASIVEDDRKQRRMLAALEARGIKRRSAQGNASATKPTSNRKRAP